MDPMDVKRIIKEYYERHYTLKFHKPDEMGQFLEQHNLSNSQKEIDSLNRPIFNEEIKSIINYLLKQKTPGPDGFTREFSQTFKEEIMPMLYNFFKNTEAKKE